MTITDGASAPLPPKSEIRVTVSTTEWDRAIVSAFIECRNLPRAAERTGVSLSTVRRTLNRFAFDWSRAQCRPAIRHNEKPH